MEGIGSRQNERKPEALQGKESETGKGGKENRTKKKDWWTDGQRS